MSGIYDPNTKEVMLAKTTSKLDDYLRTKTYVKPNDMLDPDYPVFPQPYQLASHILGGSWHEYNECALVQVASCNLACWYCYCDPELRQGKAHSAAGKEIAGWFTAEEVLKMFKSSGKKVWRISGGEPTLAPEFLVDMINGVFLEDCLLWIDTNLAGNSKFYDLVQKVHSDMQQNVAMCGCFKGFTGADATQATGRAGVLHTQFYQAKRLVEETHLNAFFYVPGIFTEGTTEKSIRTFFERMIEEVDPMAPLRTYILEVKNYSSTDVTEWNTWHAMFPGGFTRPVDVWQQLLREYYTPEQLWIPCHQVQFQKRG